MIAFFATQITVDTLLLLTVACSPAVAVIANRRAAREQAEIDAFLSVD